MGKKRTYVLQAGIDAELRKRKVRVALAGLDAMLEDADGKVPAAAEIQEKARELLVRWRETGNNEFRKAARRLVSNEGRPLDPDDREVARMRALISDNHAKSPHAKGPWQATGIIADDFPERERRSFRNRLYAKYIKKYGK